jgi:hypothetical protein
MNTAMLEEMGHKFCEALLRLAKTCTSYDQQLPDFGASSFDFRFEKLYEGSHLLLILLLINFCAPVSMVKLRTDVGFNF